MITKEEITLNDFLIPANFEDSGKIMGLFSTRNVVEAVILVLPFAFAYSSSFRCHLLGRLYCHLFL